MKKSLLLTAMFLLGGCQVITSLSFPDSSLSQDSSPLVESTLSSTSSSSSAQEDGWTSEERQLMNALLGLELPYYSGFDVGYSLTLEIDDDAIYYISFYTKSSDDFRVQYRVLLANAGFIRHTQAENDYFNELYTYYTGEDFVMVALFNNNGFEMEAFYYDAPGYTTATAWDDSQRRLMDGAIGEMIPFIQLSNWGGVERVSNPLDNYDSLVWIVVYDVYVPVAPFEDARHQIFLNYYKQLEKSGYTFLSGSPEGSTQYDYYYKTASFDSRLAIHLMVVYDDYGFELWARLRYADDLNGYYYDERELYDWERHTRDVMDDTFGIVIPYLPVTRYYEVYLFGEGEDVEMRIFDYYIGLYDVDQILEGIGFTFAMEADGFVYYKMDVDDKTIIIAWYFDAYYYCLVYRVWVD